MSSSKKSIYEKRVKELKDKNKKLATKLKKKEIIIKTLTEKIVFEKKSIESELKKKIGLQKIINSIIGTMVTPDEQERKIIIPEILKSIGIFAKADRVYIFEFDAKIKCTSNTYEWCQNKISSQKNKLQKIPVEAIPWWMDKIKSHKHIYIKDVHKMPQKAEKEQKILKEQDIKSLIVFPIFYQELTLGFLGIDFVKNFNKTYDLETLKLLDSVAALLVFLLYDFKFSS